MTAYDWQRWASNHPLRAEILPAQDDHLIRKPEVIQLVREGHAIQVTRAELEEALAGLLNPQDPGRFVITEIALCPCGMRRFKVQDTHEGDVSYAHVGNLNPHDAGHRAVRARLQKERESRS